MGKAITAFAFVLLLTGCAFSPPKVRTEVVNVDRPVLYCPAPDYEKIQRPKSLPTDAITPTTSDGEVAVRYKATIMVLEAYIQRLELALDGYKDTSSSLDDLRQQLGLGKPQQ